MSIRNVKKCPSDVEVGTRILDTHTGLLLATVTRAASNPNERPRISIRYDNGGVLVGTHPGNFYVSTCNLDEDYV